MLHYTWYDFGVLMQVTLPGFICMLFKLILALLVAPVIAHEARDSAEIRSNVPIRPAYGRLVIAGEEDVIAPAVEDAPYDDPNTWTDSDCDSE